MEPQFSRQSMHLHIYLIALYIHDNLLSALIFCYYLVPSSVLYLFCVLWDHATYCFLYRIPSIEDIHLITI
jgi:hypothetical protein